MKLYVIAFSQAFASELIVCHLFSVARSGNIHFELSLLVSYCLWACSVLCLSPHILEPSLSWAYYSVNLVVGIVIELVQSSYIGGLYNCHRHQASRSSLTFHLTKEFHSPFCSRRCTLNVEESLTLFHSSPIFADNLHNSHSNTTVIMWCFSAVQLHLPLNPILHPVLKCQCCCTGGQVQSRHSHNLPAWMHYCECACVLKSSLSFVQEAEWKPQTVVICSICKQCLQTAHYVAKQCSALRVVCDL